MATFNNLNILPRGRVSREKERERKKEGERKREGGGEGKKDRICFFLERDATVECATAQNELTAPLSDDFAHDQMDAGRDKRMRNQHDGWESHFAKH